MKSQLSKDKSLLHVIIEMIDKSDRDVLSFASDLPTLNAAASGKACLRKYEQFIARCTSFHLLTIFLEINEFNTTMWQTNANLEALQFIIDCTDAQHTAHISFKYFIIIYKQNLILTLTIIRYLTKHANSIRIDRKAMECDSRANKRAGICSAYT